MSLSEEALVQRRWESRIPILETERLTLRPPRHEDVKVVAVLANDRRIAENTARIAHPYDVDDAERFVANANKRAGEACFVITLDDTLIGACGVESIHARMVWRSAIGSERAIGDRATPRRRCAQ